MKIKKNVLQVIPLAVIFGVVGVYLFANSSNNESKPVASESASISMRIDGDLKYQITPEAEGTYTEKTLNINVSTNSPNGYSLMMATKGDNGNTIAMAGQKEGIKSVDREYLKTEIPMNSWGYSVGGESLKPIPAQNRETTIRKNNVAVENEKTDITFGAKIVPTLKSGRYSAVIEFTALADGPCVGFYCISKMQEMTPAICNATPTPNSNATKVIFRYSAEKDKIPRTILTDTRDGKRYLVSKHADGNCWMSQNLDLRLSPTTILTREDTDLKRKPYWRPTGTTAILPNEVFSRSARGDETTYGDYNFWASRDSFAAQTDLYLRNGNELANSASVDDGTADWEKIGTYYKYNAVTLGLIDEFYKSFDEGPGGGEDEGPNRGPVQGYNGDEGDGEDEGEEDDEDDDDDEKPLRIVSAPDSICPRGWRLPSLRGDFESMPQAGGGFKKKPTRAPKIPLEVKPDFKKLLESHYGVTNKYDGLFGERFGLIQSGRLNEQARNAQGIGKAKAGIWQREIEIDLNNRSVKPYAVSINGTHVDDNAGFDITTIRCVARKSRNSGPLPPSESPKW